jgi:hypothetical protein
MAVKTTDANRYLPTSSDDQADRSLGPMVDDKPATQAVPDLDDLVPAVEDVIDTSDKPHLDPHDELPPHGDPMRQPRASKQ